MPNESRTFASQQSKILLACGIATVVTIMFWLTADTSSEFALIIAAMLLALTVLLVSFTGWDTPENTANVLVWVGIVSLLQPVVAWWAGAEMEFIGLVVAMSSVLIVAITAAIMDLVVTIKPKRVIQDSFDIRKAYVDFDDLYLDASEAISRIGVLTTLNILMGIGFTLWYPTELFVVAATVPIVGGAFSIRLLTKFAPKPASVWQAVIGLIMVFWLILVVFLPNSNIDILSYTVFLQVILPPILLTGSVVAMRQARNVARYGSQK